VIPVPVEMFFMVESECVILQSRKKKERGMSGKESN
jgi:hypothetical protein